MMEGLTPGHEAELRLAALKLSCARLGDDAAVVARAELYASFLIGADYAAAERKVKAITAMLERLGDV